MNSDKEVVLRYLEKMYDDCVKELKELPWWKYGTRLGLDDLRSSVGYVMRKIEEGYIE